jgi:hypothetical protein
MLTTSTYQATPDTRQYLRRHHTHRKHHRPRMSRKPRRQELPRPSPHNPDHRLDKVLPAHLHIEHARFHHRFKLSYTQLSSAYLSLKRLSTRIAKPTFSHLPHASYRLSEQSYHRLIASASNLKSWQSFHYLAKNEKRFWWNSQNWSIAPKPPAVYMQKCRMYPGQRRMKTGKWRSWLNPLERSLLVSSDS